MSVNRHHRRALILFGVTVALVIIIGSLLGEATHAGVWLGMNCATGLATTDGCSLTLHGWPSYTLDELAMILMIPLWTGVFSFLTAGITADHIDARAAGR